LPPQKSHLVFKTSIFLSEDKSYTPKKQILIKRLKI
jgi:hypothetical protein